MSVDTGCTETWIAVANKLALVPGRRGEVVSMNGLGTIKDRRTLQHRIAIAVGIDNNVFCFDGRGKGTIVALDANGLITVGEKFVCKGVVDPINAIVDGSIIYIACANKDSVYSIDVTDIDDIVTTIVNRYLEDTLTSVVDNDTVTKLKNNNIYSRLFSGATVQSVDYFVSNGAIQTATSRTVDSRIRADGFCSPVGSTATELVKGCPSRRSIQWITGAVISDEVIIDAECGNFMFSNSDRPSNETSAALGSGMFRPNEVVYSPAGYGLTWKVAIGIFLTDRTIAISPSTTIGGASSARVSWHEFLDGSGSDCGTFGMYISAYHAPGSTFMYIDIWEALRDGAWSGSITMPIQLAYASGSPTLEIGNWNIVDGSYVDGTPHSSVPLPYAAYNYVSPCATPFVLTKIATFYEDGTLEVT